MQDDYYKNLPAILNHRFGKIAVEMDKITTKQLKDALSEQADDNIEDKTYRLLEQRSGSNGI